MRKNKGWRRCGAGEAGCGTAEELPTRPGPPLRARSTEEHGQREEKNANRFAITTFSSC